MNNRSKKLKTLVLGAILAAVTLLLGMTPLGIIPLGFINVTIMCIPVIVGTICCGLGVGLILGAVFGIASTCSAFGVSLVPTSALVSMLMAESPFQVVLMSMIPRLMLPVTAHLVYRAFARRSEKMGKAGIGVAAATGSLTNTVLYLGMMLLLFLANGLNSSEVLAVIGGTGAIAGSLEAVAAALICYPVVLAVGSVYRKNS